MIDYSKRLVEVDAILKHLKKSDYNKIPKELIEIINKNKDTEYIWNYDETKELKEQNVDKDTFAIVSYINTNYLLNEKQKNFSQKIYRKNQQKIDNIKKEKYNPDDIFKNRKEEVHIEQNNNLPVEIKKERFFTKLINFIKNIFRF